MKNFFNMRTGLLVTALAFAALPNASASLIYDSTIVVSGAGFGNINRDLTVQGAGNQTSTSGCVGLSGNALTFGTCIPDASVFDHNGITNTGGDEPNPLDDNQKYGAPTLSALGITNASQINIIFDATQGGGSSVNITDLTLKFYDINGNLVGAIDGSQNFASTIPGNGGAGFAFKVSADELAQVNTYLATTNRLALEASFTGTGGGPESFFIAKGAGGGGGGDALTPEPGTYLMLAGGLMSIGLLRFRKQ